MWHKFIRLFLDLFTKGIDITLRLDGKHKEGFDPLARRALSKAFRTCSDQINGACANECPDYRACRPMWGLCFKDPKTMDKEVSKCCSAR